jgi:hypothetical protein
VLSIQVISHAVGGGASEVPGPTELVEAGPAEEEEAAS